MSYTSTSRNYQKVPEPIDVEVVESRQTSRNTWTVRYRITSPDDNALWAFFEPRQLLLEELIRSVVESYSNPLLPNVVFGVRNIQFKRGSLNISFNIVATIPPVASTILAAAALLAVAGTLLIAMTILINKEIRHEVFSFFKS